MSVTERLLGPVLRERAALPLITFYDDADGTRVELSAATIANWAAKTANWLRDECDLRPGDPVHVSLPAHWQTAGALLGVWWAGGHVVAEPDDAVVSLVSPDTATDPLADVTAVVALDPLGRGTAVLPPGHVDWASEVRVHGDFFTPEAMPGDTPALLGLTIDDVLAAADRARPDDGARVLSTAGWDLPDGVVTEFLAVLAAGGSLVLVVSPDASRLAERAAAEKVTATR